MREVIYLDKKENEKPVEFTHFLDDEDGFQDAVCKPTDYDKILHLGKDIANGDMFAAYEDGAIMIYKGHLNSGKILDYERFHKHKSQAKPN